MQNEAYNLGLVSVSFRPYPPREIVQAVKAAGLRVIEWGSDIHAPCRDIARLEEIAALQAEYGISCCSYGTYFRLGETDLSELKDYISAAKRLGTDILRLWCGTKSGPEMSAEEKENLFAQCVQAEALAREAQVTLCMECHQHTFTQHLADALELMEKINSPHFRMYWQPFQWQEAAENLAYAQKIAPYARHIHVFQWKDALRFSLEEGVEEWREYLQQFSGPRTLLLEFMPNNSLEELAGEAAALKKIVGDEK